MRTFDRLISALRRLPGVGPKQAERLALHLLRSPEAQARELSEALMDARSRIGLCVGCMDLAEGDLCSVCRDESRDAALLCVVEEPQDVKAIERLRFRGFYHVLHGALSPLDGVGPEALKIPQLLDRVRGSGGKVREVILATDPDTEGEATALFLAEALKPLAVRVTRIAQGVPLGGDLDYLDEVTISSALAGRREV